MSVPARQARTYTPTALPSPRARMVAFGAIMAGGVCGMLIGWRFTDIQCGGTERIVVPGRPTTVETPDRRDDSDDRNDSKGCEVIIAAGTVGGSMIGAGGVAVVSVMVLRAMGEWRTKLDIEVTPDPRA